MVASLAEHDLHCCTPSGSRMFCKNGYGSGLVIQCKCSRWKKLFLPETSSSISWFKNRFSSQHIRVSIDAIDGSLYLSQFRQNHRNFTRSKIIFHLTGEPIPLLSLKTQGDSKQDQQHFPYLSQVSIQFLHEVTSWILVTTFEGGNISFAHERFQQEIEFASNF